MEKLTTENIQFIDTYLKNSGVEFLDIRVEITDHVASAIEEDLQQKKNSNFYGVFKLYMIKNKKSLLKNAGKQRWSVDRKVLSRTRKELFTAPGLLTGLGFMVFFVNVDIAKLENSVWFTIPFGLVILAAYFVPVVLYSRLKISFLSRLSIYAYLINYGFYLLWSHLEPVDMWLGLCYGLLVWVNTGILLSAFKLSAFYKTQFSNYEKS